MRHLFESRLTRGASPLSTIVVAGHPDQDARLILAAGLTYAGYRLRLAGTGDDLLREARSEDVSLIIAEVGLPCADGPCTIEVLKRTPELRHIPVLAYSASARVVSEARALSSGADRFLGDPTRLSDVFDVVASMHAPAAREAELVGPLMRSGDAAEARWADDGGRTPSLRLERPSGTIGRPASDVRPESPGAGPQAVMAYVLAPLEALHARHDLMSEGRAPGDSTAVHRAILERLAANRLAAEAHGWTSCALERVAGMGRLRLWGMPPAGGVRAVVPDLAAA
jgi:CheY-like chemotaxis protein